MYANHRPAARRARATLLFAVRTVGLGVRARREYRADFLASVVAGVLYQLTGLVLAVTAFNALPGAGPWTLPDILLMVGLRLMAHALYVVVFANLPRLPLMIVQGKLDRMLTRPVPVLVQVACDEVNVNALGDLTIAVLFWGVAAGHMRVHWSVGSVFFCAAAAVGGMLIEAALQVTVSGLCLRSLGFESLYYLLDSLILTFAGYPVDIFPAAVATFFTFVIPIGFVAYFPGGHLAGKASEVFVSPWLAGLAPLCGVVVFTLAVLFWRTCLKHYDGGGSSV